MADRDAPLDRDPNCLFCRIVAGEIPSTQVLADEHVVVIRDIGPRAPTHVLVLPRRHIPSIREVGAGDVELLGRIVAAANEVARQEGIAERGSRLVANVGEWGGQTVPHLHVHLLGGRAMSWPPG